MIDALLGLMKRFPEFIRRVDTEATGETVYDSEPEIGWTTRLKMSLLSPFVSEQLL